MLFLILAAALVFVLLLTIVDPFLWMRVERSLTGVDRSKLIVDPAQYKFVVRLTAVAGIILTILFVSLVFSFTSALREAVPPIELPRGPPERAPRVK